MPDVDSSGEVKNFYLDIPTQTTGQFYLKGSGALDWGMLYARHSALDCPVFLCHSSGAAS